VSAPASGPVSFESVSVGISFTCTLATTGDTYCWGRNSAGQLGNGTQTEASQPVLVSDPASGPVTFVSVSAGGVHTCALASNGQVFCWGSNSHGQLGTGTTDNAAVPVAVFSNLTFESVSAGQGHTCGVTTDGDAYCWGSNDIGQLGNGTQTDASQPVLVSDPAEGPKTFLSVSGGLAHTGGVTDTGVVYCWGFNSHGQLGSAVGFGPVPVRVLDPATGPVTFASVTAGGAHTCAVTDGAAAYCWGRNNKGQLGTTEPTTDSCQGGGPCTFTPARVSPPSQSQD
jgi:alpha-tubulin suppressor-like RCC1 family protein